MKRLGSCFRGAAHERIGVRVCRQPDIVYQAKVALMLADPGGSPEDPW
jgi:hypothetical protein